MTLGPSSSRKQKYTAAHIALYLKPRRPWLAFYENAVRRVPLSGEEAADLKEKDELSLIQRMLPDELLLEIFHRLPMRYAGRCLAVCKQWRHVCESESVWRRAAFGQHEWHRGGDPAKLELEVDRLYQGSWRLMWLLRPRLRTDGLYVSRNQYIRRGQVEFRNKAPTHLVVYYRYFSFHPNGEFLYRTTPTKPALQKAMRSPKRALRIDGIYQGKLEVDGPKVHTVVAHVGSQFVVEYHFWLRIRSTQAGGSDRLDIRSFVSVDEGEEVPPEPDDEYDAYSDGFGVGWHAQEGLLGTGGSVRALNRGLTTFVFVPWEELETTELNSSADEMDYYVPG